MVISQITSASVVAALLGGAISPALAQQPAEPDEVLEILRVAVEYVRPDLPEGPIAVDFDPDLFTMRDGKEVRYHPYEYPPAELADPLAEAIGARNSTIDGIRSCRSPDEYRTSDCVVAEIRFSNPEIQGDTARVIVVWDSSIWSRKVGPREYIGYSHSYELLLERAKGIWRVKEVLDEVLT